MKFLVLIIFSFSINLLLAINEDIHVLKSEYEKKYKNHPTVYNLSKLIEIYLLDSKYEKAEGILSKYNFSKLSKENLAAYYLLLAKTYKYQIKNDLAILYFNKCFKLLKKTNDIEKKILYYIELMEFYRKIADFERAFKIIDKLIQTYKIEDFKNTELLNFFYNRHAAILNERAKLTESISLSLEAIELAKKTKNIYAEAVSYNELGFSYKNLLDNTTSIQYYEKAFDLWMSIGCYRDAVHAKYNKNIVISHNDLLPSSKQIELNLELINLIDSLKIDYPISKIYLLIEFHNVILKNWKLAHYFRSKADTALHIEQQNANFKTLSDLKEKYENEQLKEKNISIQRFSIIQKEKLKISEARFWWIFIFFLIVATLSTILFILWRKNKIQNKKLIEQNKQKNFLIQEVHHRVKNNLQFMKSVLLLQESLDELTAKETIEDISRRLDAVSMVHEMLYIDNPGIDLSVKDYLEKLITVSSSLYQSEKKIEFNLNIDSIELPIEKLIAIGIICSELLANSVKHVLVDNENLIFSIQLVQKSNLIEILIKDNGIETKKLVDDKRFKLGMRIIEIFSKKLDAKIKISTETNYNFHISFLKDSI